MSLYLSHEIHDNNDDNQQRSAAEVELNVPRNHHEFRNQTNKCYIQSASQSQSRHYFVDVARGLLTRADTWDKRT